MILELPTPLPIAKPVLLTVTWGEEEAQVTNGVRSWVVPSEKFPVALSCSLVPAAIEELAGVMSIEVSTASVTVTVVAPDTPPRVAVIGALPTAFPVTKPRLTVLSTVAMVPDDEVQLTWVVRF